MNLLTKYYADISFLNMFVEPWEVSWNIESIVMKTLLSSSVKTVEATLPVRLY